MEAFEAYFQSADLNQNGKISGSEALEFLRGFNLPNHVVAQIWTYADQNKTGFLGREEFYNALKLVRVVQCGLVLTPDVVKATFDAADVPAPVIDSSPSAPPSAPPSPTYSEPVSPYSAELGLSGIGSSSSRSGYRYGSSPRNPFFIPEIDNASGARVASPSAQVQWPEFSQTDIDKYTNVFIQMDKDRDGRITSTQAQALFMSWNVPREILKQVWDLSDQDNDGTLTMKEFCVALYFMERHREGYLLPNNLPVDLLYDEMLLRAVSSATNGGPTWNRTIGTRSPEQPYPPSQIGVAVQARNQQGSTRLDTDVYLQLQEAFEEIKQLKKENFNESSRRKEAEDEVLLGQQQIKEIHESYLKERNGRKQIEEIHAREKQLTELLKQEVRSLERKQDEYLNRLQAANEQRLMWARCIAESDRNANDLAKDLEAFRFLLDSLQQENIQLHNERDTAVRDIEEFHKRRRQMNSEFTIYELQVATQNFSDSMKIGQGGFGSVYKGLLRNTTVAIKVLNPDSLQGETQFEQEVAILSRVRHPNLVNLIGACSQVSALVYEFLPNGSLEDRLKCLHNSPPLTWRTRNRIIAEICSALIFLHKNKPHPVVHGDLKPANILLDANLVSKLSDFGISRRLFELSPTNTAVYFTENPKGTIAYMDPEFLTTGELTPASDIYSFGITILCILSGKPPQHIARIVSQALENNDLQSVIDASAGDWPFVQAKKLASIALKCADIRRRNRPDLMNEVWKIVGPLMNTPTVSMSRHSSRTSFDGNSAPSYFLCPISQDIMRDPHIAADGFTYEAEVIKAWFDLGHNTSPMTNLPLPNRELIPNHGLRSGIQEYLQQED